MGFSGMKFFWGLDGERERVERRGDLAASECARCAGAVSDAPWVDDPNFVLEGNNTRQRPSLLIVMPPPAHPLGLA